jgi:general secretion pathway protein A
VKDLIHEFTGGVPRSINNIAITCLLGASSKRTLRIDEEVFQLAATEMHWN